MLTQKTGERVSGAPVVVLGPTASGKSDVAMAAARAVSGVEIVAVDAMQVYRGMDIGTAKPSADDQVEVRHHGIDLVEPTEPFGVTDYVAAYDAALTTIADGGGRPLLVAGTGLYLTAVIDRLEFPGQFPEVRSELETEPDTAALHARLAELDPVAADRMEPGNRRRIVRALEVTLGGGRRFSEFGPGVSSFPPTDATMIGLRWPREVLTERIEQRVHRMIDAGLVDEVRRVRVAGMSHTAAQALGYKELLAHLDGEVTETDAVAMIVQRTRQFAVRQERWFRRDPRIRWIDVAADPVAEAARVVIAALRRPA